MAAIEAPKSIEVKPVTLTTDFLGHGRPMDTFLNMAADAGFERMLWCEGWDGSKVYDAKEVTEIDRLTASLGLRITQIHASEGGVEGDTEKTNYGQWVSPDESERRKGVAGILNRFDMAADLGADVVTLHAPHHEMNWEGGPQAYQKAMQKSLAEINEYRLRKRISARLGLENTDWEGEGKFDNFPAIEFALGEFGPEFLGITYDSGHANVLSGQIDVLERHADRLIDTHLHDNSGKGAAATKEFILAPDRKNHDDDMHRTLFTGTVDVVRLAGIMAQGDAPVTSEASMKYDSELNPRVWLALERDNLEAFSRMVEAIRVGAPIDLDLIAQRRARVLRGVLVNPVGPAPKNN